MELSIPHHSKGARAIVFTLLLLYSLLPGLYKILGMQMLMACSLPILFLLCKILKIRPHFRTHDIFFIAYVSYILLQSLLFSIFGMVNRMGITLGLFMNIAPMVGYLFPSAISLRQLSPILLRLIALHAILAIALYPAFNLISPTNPTAEKLLDGVAFMRMASVSGSLGFGSMMTIGFALAFFFDRRYLPLMLICLIFSCQRSAWLGGIFTLLIYTWEALRTLNLSRLVAITVGTILLAILFYTIAVEHLNIDFNFILSRLSNLGSATSERSDMWVSGLENFTSAPWGVGVGQVGQIATRVQGAETIYKLVPDGEYIRILSESGLIGGFFLVGLVITLLTRTLCGLPTRASQCVAAIIGGMLIQMLGSNVHEFYFTNFLLWIFIGYLFTTTNTQKI